MSLSLKKLCVETYEVSLKKLMILSLLKEMNVLLSSLWLNSHLWDSSRLWFDTCGTLQGYGVILVGLFKAMV